MQRVLIASLCWLILIGNLTFASPQLGADAGSFIGEGIGARALALGGSFVAFPSGSSAGFWNPAGVALTNGYHVGGMYSNRFGDPNIVFQYFSFFGGPNTKKTTVDGFNITWVNSNITGIPFTGGSRGGTFSVTHSLLLFSLGAVVDPNINPWSKVFIGFNLKFYRTTILTASGQGAGFDIGFLITSKFNSTEVFSGIVVTDIFGTIIKWYGTLHNPRDIIPSIIKFGVAVLFSENALLFTAEINSTSPSIVSPSTSTNFGPLRCGIELKPIPQIAIRGGIILWQSGAIRPSIGIGITPHEGLAIDYAYVYNEYGLGGTHYISGELQLPSL